MFLQGFTGWHFLIILAVILLLFGATKLPALAKGVGQSMRIFKNEVKNGDSDTETNSAKLTTDSAKTDPNK